MESKKDFVTFLFYQIWLPGFKFSIQVLLTKPVENFCGSNICLGLSLSFAGRIGLMCCSTPVNLIGLGQGFLKFGH
jgi:hypothetical protein